MSRSLLIEIFRSIRKTKSRFVSIIVIIALGAAVFVGTKASQPDMKNTVYNYFLNCNLMDLRVQSTLGLTEDDIKAIKTVDGVEYVMPSRFADALVFVNGQPETDIDGSQISARAYGIKISQMNEFASGSNSGDFINRPELIEGNYPVNSNECLVDASTLSTPDSYKIGAKITLKGDGESDVSSLKCNEFTVVGIIRSPYYLSYERGNSLVGSGKIGTFIIVPDEAFNMEYYTEAYIKVSGSDEFDTLSQSYYDHIQPIADRIAKKSTAQINTRAKDLASTLPQKIADSKAEYKKGIETYNKTVAEAEKQIALYQSYVDDPDKAYAEKVEQFASEFGLAQNQYSGNKSQYYSAVEQYSNLLNTYNTKAQELATSKTNLDEANATLISMQNQLTTVSNAINTYQNTVTTMSSLIDSTNSIIDQLNDFQNSKMNSDQLNAILNVIQSSYGDIFDVIKAQSMQGIAAEAKVLLQTELTSYQVQLATAQEGLDAANEKLSQANEKLALARVEYDNKKAMYEAGKVQLTGAKTALEKFYDELQINKDNLTLAQVELMIGQQSGESSLESFKLLLANAEDYLQKAKTAYINAKSEGEKKLNTVKSSISNAERLLNNLNTATWSVYDRTDTPGYSSFSDALKTINLLSNIFPVVFFIVSALVCLVTMTRMVEEERTQMGTLKALGYSNSSICSKYVLYAFFASFIGSTIGFVLGIYIIPFTINKAYSVMFALPDLKYLIPFKFVFLGMGISLSVTIAATLVACRKEIIVKPAMLMRPKAPKAGKRVLLEKIPAIWRRLNFTSKVTVRNLARNKTRLFMTVIGICGCMTLILGILGFYTSLIQICDRQYGTNGIFNFDYQLVFDSNQNPSTSVMRSVVSGKARSFMFVSMQSVSGGNLDADKNYDVYLFTPENAEAMAGEGGYINLYDRKNNTKLSLTDDGAVITEKFAKQTNIKVGDKVRIELADGKRVNIPVVGVCENYMFSYVYLTENCYKNNIGASPKYLYAIGSLTDEFKNDENFENTKGQFATELMKYDSINAVSYLQDTIEQTQRTLNIVSIVVLIFIIAAGILAFVVLYNLTNINISERKRELATIKVLGFTNFEVSNYIYRENAILTFLGIILGIFGGMGLHRLMINYVNIESIMFGQSIVWYDYILAVVITLLFAVIVNLIMHKKMKKIDMVESLKSVE